MVRMRYIKNGTSLVSKTPLLAGNKLVTVHINTETLQYSMVDEMGTKLTESMVYKNLAAVKKAAKQFLKLSGVNFQDEMRKKNEQAVVENT